MDNMEAQIGSILGNPEMMQKIMAMAQTLNGQSESPPQQPPQSNSPAEQDMAMLQSLSGIAKHSSIDQQQQNLLRALHPYLSRERIQKLEKAMRAAKMAKFAAAALGAQGGMLPFAR